MSETESRNRMWTGVAAVLMAMGRAMAQEHQAIQGQGPVEQRRIVVSIPDRKLALLVDGKVVRMYPAAVGADGSPSPVGNFTVIRMVANPTWWHEGKVYPPGRNNPVGSRWIGLSEKGYGIHGTNAPGSIGRNASHGCIRMLNRDVEQLYKLLKIGDVVELHGELDGQITQIFHPVMQPVLTATAGGGGR